jgi:hypothetical protein
MWKPLQESRLLRPHFPFDPFLNLPRSCPLFTPLIRVWTDPGTAPDARDKPNAFRTSKHATTTDESGIDDKDDLIDSVNDVWSFHPITAALVGDYRGSPIMGPMDDADEAMMCSPFLASQSSRQDLLDCIDIGENLVLNRIISSRTFAPAP